jgi:hypothetical protein
MTVQVNDGAGPPGIVVFVLSILGFLMLCCIYLHNIHAGLLLDVKLSGLLQRLQVVESCFTCLVTLLSGLAVALHVLVCLLSVLMPLYISVVVV